MVDQPSALDVMDPEIAGVVEQMAAGMVALFYPHVEAALHDVRRDRIVRLWNAYSQREVGDESLMDPDQVRAANTAEVMGPYEQVTVDGRHVSSVSVPLLAGRYLFCLNFDRAPLAEAVALLDRFAKAIQPSPEALLGRDWQQELNRAIDGWCREHQRHRDGLAREDRRAIVAHLDALGLFDTKNAADHAARALGISRSSTYSLLRDVRDRTA